MELSAENYETAWELVVQRYDNPQRRLEIDLYDLFETEPLTETSKGIGVAMDSVHQLMRSLIKLEDFQDSIFCLPFYICPQKETRWHNETTLGESSF